MDDYIYSYEPVIDSGCHTLILGTMPSVKSLADGFYYAHPRNAFWPIMARILGEERPQTIEQKKELLLSHGCALWDTVRSCRRTGSLDAAMRDVELNDFAGLLARYPRVRRVFLNGGEAWRLFHRADPAIFSDRLCLKLPSTSPAYTLPYERKLAAWQDAFAGLTERVN